MKIELDKIGPEGYDHDSPIEPAWLAEALGPRAPFGPAGQGRLTVHLARVGDVVHVRGKVYVKLKADCGRCLEPLDFDLNAALEVALFPKGAEPAPGPDGELSEEDMGVATYEGGVIDLSELVKDEIFLEMPMNPMCSYERAADCPNFQKYAGPAATAPESEPETPSPAGGDPRWAGLKRIKLS